MDNPGSRTSDCGYHVDMDGHQVTVDAETLSDLLALVDRLLSHVIEDQLHDAADIRDVPMAVTDGLRGAVAEIRVRALVSS